MRSGRSWWIVTLCVALIHSTTSDEQQVLSAKVYFPQRALDVYEQLIAKAQAGAPECTLNHTLRFEALNKSIDGHWHTCLTATSNPNIFFLIGCMQVKSHSDVEELLADVNEIKECLSNKKKTTEAPRTPALLAEWTKQVADLKTNLTAVRSSNEFYVAVENAKLANHTKCYSEFSPLVSQYSSSIDTVVDNCRKFVPVGHLDEFKQCCDDLTQPIVSDVESKLMYLNNCFT